MSGRYSLLIAVLLLGGALARAQSPPPSPPPAPPPRAQPAPPAEPPAPPREGDPDEDLLEFLGSDDVGDAAWWDFLKRSQPPGSNTAVAPDGKQ